MPKGLQKIHFTFEEKGLTYFAGFPIIYQFAKVLQLKRVLQKKLQLSHRNTYYHWADLILSHFYYTVAGIERLDHLVMLKHNGLLAPLTGLTRLPGTRAMRDFLLGITLDDLAQIMKLHDTIRYRMFYYPQEITTAVIDFDSSVITVYGTQELADVGYNPQKAGRRSYRPLFAFEAHLKISLHAELRPGKSTDKEAVAFIAYTLNKIPSTIAQSRTRVRCDAGFYCKSTIEFLDETQHGYVIVAQMTKPIKNMLPGLRYRIFNHRYKLAIAEFRYQPHGWKKEHRFIVMRYTLPPKPEDRTRNLFTMDRYEYHVFVTNLDLDPEHVWYFYNGRAAVEIDIKELKMDFFISKIPTRKFLANQSHLQLLLLDYNLFRWFQILCLPPNFQTKTLRWIRRNILIVPGKFITPAHRSTVQFPKSFMQKNLFQQIYKNTAKVKPLLK